ncbi:hypothetical protein CC1G_01669 [Coprinopsis cinerea okayama7|uniref:GYF domain-containing protein n=1 Tax=Coprinopsis cinerea (strain Okayama-7 / 130 / ATCC MYA-4618 / FGSC 9003) TaxID=240176 RepID=A8N2G9_COPC7|nr:hypothetical protein CC1G_01669 [Coprinopsis cinerea okayama7\|eukprot:XP_001828989.1 hypothetical protein CC1G_01669 [Coprinopsis cinerea okayama7\
MATTTMHFGPEWMRTKHQPLRPQQPPSPPPNSQNTLSTYSALVSTVPGVENDKYDDAHPFRYTKEELLRIYKESPKGGLGLEVERWEGVVREIGAEPIALREMGEAEKKLFSGPLNSDLRRRQSTDYLSPLNTSSLGDRPRLNHAPNSATASPLRDRYPALKRRDSNADSPTTTMPRKQSLSSLQAPNAGSRSAALPSPRNRPGYPSFDGVLNTGDSWSSRRRASEASQTTKPVGIARELSGDTEDRVQPIQEDGADGQNGTAGSTELPRDGKTSQPNTVGGQNGQASSDAAQQSTASANVPNANAGSQDLAAVEWSYKDPAGNVQGPFRADLMQKWFDDGYFTMDLPMKRTQLDTTWMTLEELIKRATVPDKMFLCPLLPPGGPPGLSRRNDSPLQTGSQNEHNPFSNPYQPAPIRNLRSSTLDSLNGSNPTDSPTSSLGHFGNNSPDSLAFANRVNHGFTGEANNAGFPGGGVDLTPLRQRQVADLVHDSPLRLHSPSYNSLIGNHHLGYDGYGYSGFTPVQSSPWGTPSQPFSNYNHNVGFGTSTFGPTSAYGLGHHNQAIGNQVNPHLYANQDILGQQQQLHGQGYFDPTPIVNGVLNDPNDTFATNQPEQYQQISPVEAKADSFSPDITNANQDKAKLDSPSTIARAPSWDVPSDNTAARRAGPFDAVQPTPLNTTVPTIPSQSSPWGQPTSASFQGPAQAKEVSPWGVPSQGPNEPAWSEPQQAAPEPTVDQQGAVEERSPVESRTAPAPGVEVSESTPEPAAPSPTKSKGSKSPTTASTPLTDAGESTESPVVAQPPKAPWAKADKKKGKMSTTISLREIQDAEAKLAEARKEKEKERARLAAAAAATSGDSKEDIQPFTASWGLPTSQAGSRSTILPKEVTSTTPTPTPAAAPVWTSVAKAPIAKKTMKEIQEEEERRKKAAAKEVSVAAAPVKRGYAEQAVKATPTQSAAPSPGNAWVTVGASGKPSTPVGSAPRPAATVISSVPAGTSSMKTTTPSTTRSAASVARPSPAPGAKVEDFPVSPSHEFLKWLSESLKGLNSSVNVEEIISMLLSFSLDPDPTTIEIISDTIYASSTTLDGRRFAAEFVSRRKADAANRKGPNAAKGPTKPISIAEVVKATPKTAQSEWGFKVVNKKKKGGRS